MTLLSELERLIDEGKIATVLIGRSVMVNLGGEKRMCQVHLDHGAFHAFKGRGDTTEEAIRDALRNFNVSIKEPEPSPPEADVGDLGGLLG